MKFVAVLFVFMSFTLALAASELDYVKVEMEAELEVIERDMKVADRTYGAGFSSFPSALFDSSFGFPSYLKIMAMLQRSRFTSDVVRIVQEVRLMYFERERGYDGIDVTHVSEVLGGRISAMDNPFGGRYTVGPAADGRMFCVQASGIKSDSCSHFVSMKWEGARDFDGSDNGGSAIVLRGDFKDWRAPGKGSTCSDEKDALHTLYFCYR